MTAQLSALLKIDLKVSCMIVWRFTRNEDSAVSKGTVRSIVPKADRQCILECTGSVPSEWASNFSNATFINLSGNLIAGTLPSGETFLELP